MFSVGVRTVRSAIKVPKLTYEGALTLTERGGLRIQRRNTRSGRPDWQTPRERAWRAPDLQPGLGNMQEARRMALLFAV